ncbi:molybdate ABC transporter substrate-binding protein [Microbacterium indicum]|uniref:molybdate ABC transporter substrate-binding protein n=1 Tax=Microbacterium indicum TaxID=358100 RepID=UPI000402F559|nr:molybdate ABC transporter substrate-binding protein [Microbacterium indicum]
MKTHQKTPLAALSLLIAVPLALAGCSTGSDDTTDSASGSASDGTTDSTTLVVAAAASLQNAFTDIGSQFEDEHSGVTVSFTFDGSSGLVSQLQEGAPGSVFASADEANMDKAVDAGLTTGDPQVFARNTLEIVTPPDNPAGIETLADLASGDVDVAICAAQVPCGAATQQVLENADLTLTPASEEQSVTDVLGRVTSGEADAGLVYVTDVTSAGDEVTAIPFDGADAVVNDYPIATLDDSDLAQDFVDYVLSDAGQEVLASYGFVAP